MGQYDLIDLKYCTFDQVLQMRRMVLNHHLRYTFPVHYTSFWPVILKGNIHPRQDNTYMFVSKFLPRHLACSHHHQPARHGSMSQIQSRKTDWAINSGSAGVHQAQWRILGWSGIMVSTEAYVHDKWRVVSSIGIFFSYPHLTAFSFSSFLFLFTIL